MSEKRIIKWSVDKRIIIILKAIDDIEASFEWIWGKPNHDKIISAAMKAKESAQDIIDMALKDKEFYS